MREELKEQIERVLSDPKIGIVLLTEKLAGLPGSGGAVKMNYRFPLFVETLTVMEPDVEATLLQTMSKRRSVCKS